MKYLGFVDCFIKPFSTPICGNKQHISAFPSNASFAFLPVTFYPHLSLAFQP